MTLSKDIFYFLIVVVGSSSAQTYFQENQCLLEASGRSKLSCTANDVKLGVVTNVNVDGQICTTSDPCICSAGETITVQGDFEVILSTNIRYDIGLYFGQDGVSALTDGSCIVFTPPNDAPGYQTDPPPDICGDISQQNPPSTTEIILEEISCDGAGGLVQIPYCSTWKQPGGNTLCDSAAGIIPGSPSKCSCDKVTLPILIAPGVSATLNCMDVNFVDTDQESLVYTFWVSVTNTGEPPSSTSPGAAPIVEVTIDGTPNLDGNDPFTVTTDISGGETAIFPDAGSYTYTVDVPTDCPSPLVEGDVMSVDITASYSSSGSGLISIGTITVDQSDTCPLPMLTKSDIVLMASCDTVLKESIDTCETSNPSGTCSYVEYTVTITAMHDGVGTLNIKDLAIEDDGFAIDLMGQTTLYSDINAGITSITRTNKFYSSVSAGLDDTVTRTITASGKDPFGCDLDQATFTYSCDPLCV